MKVVLPREKVEVVIYRRMDGGTIQYLLLHSARGERSIWQHVTGSVEPTDPSLQSAAIREAKEETGLEPLHMVGPIYEYTFVRTWTGVEDDRVVEHCFMAEVPAKSAVTLSHEHDEFVWAEWEEATEQLSFRSFVVALFKAHLRIVLGNGEISS